LEGWINREGIRGDARLKFTEFKLLHDVMDDMCKKITVKIPIQQINDKSIAAFERIFKDNKGKQSLSFTIWDAEEQIELNVPSRNTKIKITSELLQTLEQQHVNFKLN
jgi:DNA polymerase-3 subunit alpha